MFDYFKSYMYSFRRDDLHGKTYIENWKKITR